MSSVLSFEEKPFRAAFVWGVLVLTLITGLKVVGTGLGFFSNAATVAQQEFSPQAMLRKYEWFKDSAASLQRQSANMDAYELRIKQFKEDYGDVPKIQWSRDDRQAYNQLYAEYQGMLQMYNNTVSEYNSQSSKFNWRQFDQTEGDVPAKQFQTRGAI